MENKTSNRSDEHAGWALISSAYDGLGWVSSSRLVFKTCGFSIATSPFYERIRVLERAEAKKPPPTTNNGVEKGFLGRFLHAKKDFCEGKRLGIKHVPRGLLEVRIDYWSLTPSPVS